MERRQPSSISCSLPLCVRLGRVCSVKRVVSLAHSDNRTKREGKGSRGKEGIVIDKRTRVQQGRNLACTLVHKAGERAERVKRGEDSREESSGEKRRGGGEE
mmetsp:Transcript_4874/g.10313  ORF Transcript_4874/g.10313 Transcript_4874/m.10313 type:complete len:102 (+) Transcript_4874:343-648(+)